MPPAALPPAAGALPPAQGVLQDRNYRAFIASRVFSSLGFQSITVALAWMLYDRTGNAYMLGFLGLAQFLPMAALTFVVGAAADRFDRRRIGLACQGLEAVTVALLGVLFWQGALSPPLILSAAALLGAAVAFERPTMAALLPGIVGPAMLQRAVATSTSFMQTALIIGPSLGGLLYGFGAGTVFAASTLLFCGAAASIALIRRAGPAPKRARMSFGTIFAGVAFIRSRPEVLGTISLDLFAVLLGGATALLPVFAADILRAGPIGLGMLRAAPAVGALLMSLWLARHPIERGAGRRMFLAVGVFGLATIVFSLSRSVPLSVLALFVVGASDTISVVVRSSLVQLLTPDDMRGRVNAVNSLFIGTSNQLGEFESGMVAGAFGPVAAGLIGGMGTIAVVLMWMRLFPQLARVERLDGK
ncbi:MFS transporter [Paroceanicella profunda]|uniref:MFS transporter n=2 Tax=Paroceanicella profunda TaxID=2579971 RepID=A0A5B8FIR7_9RHOB|nr:MFS transporter [Paroceanicella profunda]